MINFDACVSHHHQSHQYTHSQDDFSVEAVLSSAGESSPVTAKTVAVNGIILLTAHIGHKI